MLNGRIAACCFALMAGMLVGCATVSKPASPTEAPIARAEQQRAQKSAVVPETTVLKRKVGIARFSNETRYGRTLLRDESLDPLGKQASDMLASRLIASGKFLVFERPDLEKVENEQAILHKSDLIGIDTLILGSLTEFGRSTTGKAGFLSSTKKQIAHAKVDIRLVDARTGYAFFSATGTGEATTESGEIAGFGSKADYDAALNDRAIAAAISDVLNELVTKLEERQWRSDILKVDRDKVYISGGKFQGLEVGDVLAIMREGEKVKSQQTGFEITLPSTEIGAIKILSLFGDSEANEGAVGTIVSGAVPEGRPEGIYVAEKEGGSK
jgi:curli biogenesis system outer membrane secretion channel CsgG